MNDKIYVVDFSEVTEITDIHNVLAKAFAFPDYYGKNWDAFWDCLTDIAEEGIRIDVYGFRVLEDKFSVAASEFAKIMEDFENYSGATVGFVD